jgi:cellulose synthase/poly-beta-1,6-N-acetylglucosamine synthase-like glycosyltransferase
MLSVIIPVYNEKDNLVRLTKNLSIALNKIDHELLFVDDHSTDGSAEVIIQLRKQLPKDHIRLLEKQGTKGKAISILEGIIESKGNIIAMIDADLQYPAAAIPEMMHKLTKGYDIVIGNRKQRDESVIRRNLSRLFNFVFAKVILNLPYDAQSGLKVFRKQTLNGLRLSPSPWGFDYEFLFKAKRMGWKIGQVDIGFARRTQGQSKVRVLATGIELAWGAVKLRIQYIFRNIFKFLDDSHPSERLGINWNNDKDFLYVPEIMSAKHTVYSETISLAIILLAGLAGLIWGLYLITGVSLIVIMSGLLAAFYIIMMWFKVRVIYHAINRTFLEITPEELDAINPYDLPTYTILIPLYKEAEVIKQVIQAMSAIDYPTEKLDIIITLEEYDHETIEAIANANPPSHFKTLILPDVKPKTKPKALNVAFPYAKGEFLVIYDAEIVPDPDQLKKAYVAFTKHQHLDALQTRLDHYNPEQSLITRLFNEEFAFHFDMLLPGLQKLGYPIPLAGHSVHFRRSVLEEIGAWDPYNVTEDADMGMRLARSRFNIEILNSVSREEATTSISAWIGQRTRWIKGFIQTSIVHLRHPIRFKQEIGKGWSKVFAFGITVPSSVLINIFNLVYWSLLIAWFTTHSQLIRSLFPGPIYYVSLFSFIFGNLVFVYLNLLSSYNRARYSSVKYGLLSPLYWLMLAYASVKATVEFMVKPHHWSKTTHGKHLIPNERERVGTYVIRSPQIEI